MTAEVLIVVGLAALVVVAAMVLLVLWPRPRRGRRRAGRRVGRLPAPRPGPAVGRAPVVAGSRGGPLRAVPQPAEVTQTRVWGGGLR